MLTLAARLRIWTFSRGHWGTLEGFEQEQEQEQVRIAF